MLTCPSCGRDSPEEFDFCPGCGAPLGAIPVEREVRKIVSVVFCDLVGSTTLAERHDPEVLKPVLQRYFEEMRAAVEAHGGRVEKFIGDAVVAVFGIPQAHEDDALRAVRAAAEMRDRLAAFADESSIELVGRIGLTTGEVLVVGEDKPPIGDAMNTAARLQTSAQPGEILLGEPTYRLVQDAVVAEPIEPLALKGKADRVPGYRLVQVASLSPMRTRRLDAPMVGRARERVLLEQAFERAVSDRACQLFTVLGAAGAGKSRLIEEFLSGLEGASVMRGRCLPYGDGITYFPVVEAMKEPLGLADFDDESSVWQKIHAAVAEEDHAGAITANLAKLMAAGEGGEAEETFWAIRRFLEAQGRRCPVAVVFDDIHWGESTFLDLVEHVADWSREAPILLLCMARPDLLDVRPRWAGGKTNAATISLAPLTEAECAELIDHLVGSSDLPEVVRTRITGIAEGNPLFVEEMLRMLIDDGLLVREGDRWVPVGDLGEVSVPPTISALLSARLDRLSSKERTAIEAAAVCGKEFHRGAVAHLVAEGVRRDIDVHLRSLVRRELVGPERSLLPGEDAFRFRHLLIRDAAYDAIPKQERADLHEAFADWLERIAGERVVEQEEIIGYHLEQAHGYRTELGRTDEHTTAIAARAGERLAAAGLRAEAREDASAAVNLLQRASSLLPLDHARRREVAVGLGRSLAARGEFARAEVVLEQVTEEAERAGDGRMRWSAEVERTAIRARVDPTWLDADHLGAVERAVEAFRALGDEAGMARAHLLVGPHGNWVDVRRAAELALEHAERAGAEREAGEAMGLLAISLFWGPDPAEDCITRCRHLGERAPNRGAEALTTIAVGGLVSLPGRFDEARDLVARGRDILLDLGLASHVSYAFFGGEVEQLAGEPSAAEERYREGYDRLAAIGEKNRLSTLAAKLADVIWSQGREDEALSMARIAHETASPDDVDSHTTAEMVEGRAMARAGRVDDAVVSMRRAIEAFRPRRSWQTAPFLMDLAVVLAEAGRTDEAQAVAEEARSIFLAKGVVPWIERSRSFLADLHR